MHNWADQAEHAGASTKYPASLLYLCSLPLDSVASQPSCRYLPLDVILCLLSDVLPWDHGPGKHRGAGEELE